MKLKRLFLILYFSIIAFLSFGQVNPDCPPTDPNYPDCLNNPRAPITETIIILLAGGIGLGIKSISKKRKNQ